MSARDLPSAVSAAPTIGALVGWLVPFVSGIAFLFQVAAYNAAHPLGPGEARCGMPAFGAVMMIVVVSPVGALTGCLLGFAVATFWQIAMGISSTWRTFRDDVASENGG